MAKGNNQKSNDSGLNFEAQLWAAADKMRGHIRGIDANLGPRNDDSFRADLHPDLSNESEICKALIEADLANTITNN